MSVKISVIVPVYNAEKYIIRCLESIYNQSIDSEEIIIVNDGSTDTTLSVLYEFQASHKGNEQRKIIIVDKPNGGPSSARNAGLNKATGEYIGFVDCDDYIEKDMYKHLIAIADQKKMNVVLCNILNIYSDGRKIPSTVKVPVNCQISREEILKYICPTLMKEDVFGGPCNRIYRREYLEKNYIRMPEKLGYGEDAVFQMQVFDKLDSTWFDVNCYYHYIHRVASQSSAKPGRLKNTLEPLYRYRCKYGEKWNIDRKEIANYFVYCAIMDLLSTMTSKTYKNKIAYLKEFKSSSLLRSAIQKANLSKTEYTVKIYYCYLLLKKIMK